MLYFGFLTHLKARCREETGIKKCPEYHLYQLNKILPRLLGEESQAAAPWGCPGPGATSPSPGLIHTEEENSNFPLFFQTAAGSWLCERKARPGAARTMGGSGATGAPHTWGARGGTQTRCPWGARGDAAPTGMQHPRGCPNGVGTPVWVGVERDAPGGCPVNVGALLVKVSQRCCCPCNEGALEVRGVPGMVVLY